MDPKSAQLEDIISYAPPTLFSDEELALIRSHFNGPTGAQLLRILWKALIPSVHDAELPMELIGQDLYLGLIDFKSVPADEAKSLAMGLQYTVKGIMGGLTNLKNLANIKSETDAERAARAAKNSSK